VKNLGASGQRIPALRRIGIDLDNTIVDYRDVLRAEFALLGIAMAEGDARSLRHVLRERAGGEALWTSLQARIYGPLMERAEPFAGARRFLERARSAGIEVAIVSHKTELAAVGSEGPNLREAAREWLIRTEIVPELIPPEAVFFEDTRSEKAQRIARLRPDAFLDDLIEVFRDPRFPAGVERWLFGADREPQDCVDRAFASWDALGGHVFGSGHVFGG